MKFIDSIQIDIRSGHGGAGLVSFRAAKNRPRLGADGGDGGFGGSVFLVGGNGLNTLSGLYYKRLYAAEDGVKGGANGRTGRNGNDMVIPVPLGTVATDIVTGRVVCEVLEHEQKYLVAAGGKRGLGNARYLSSTHQAPEEHTGGGPSSELNLQLELNLIADVGFAGFPNAGKSTLLSRISHARPKIADYPFTTLVPYLGVVSVDPGDEGRWGSSFVAADIPGLVEGASQGRGLGHDFLKHLERTKVIAYVIDGFDMSAPECGEAFLQLQKELSCYSQAMGKKRHCVIVTKSDLCADDDTAEFEEKINKIRQLSRDVFVVSAVSSSGIQALIRGLYQLIVEESPRIAQETVEQKTASRDGEYEFVVRNDELSSLM